MFGLAILEVVVGLLVSYALLGGAAALIASMVADRLHIQESHSGAALRVLLGDDRLASMLLSHPIIKGLGGPVTDLPGWVLLSALVDIGRRERVRVIALESFRVGRTKRVEQPTTAQEQWLELGMHRISKSYRLRIWRLAFAATLAVCLVVGTDTIALATTIWHFQGIKTSLASISLGSGVGGLEDASNFLSQFDLPLSWTALPATALGWYYKVIGIGLTAVASWFVAGFWLYVADLTPLGRQRVARLTRFA